MHTGYDDSLMQFLLMFPSHAQKRHRSRLLLFNPMLVFLSAQPTSKPNVFFLAS